MRSVFLDTDVILDLFILREPHHSEALRLFSQLRRTKTKCYTSPVVVANIYYLLVKIRNNRYALDRIRKLRNLLAIATLNEAIIDAAIASPHKDFEDSIQYHCALKNDIKVLITRNTQDYPKDQLTIAKPRDYTDIVTMEKNG